MPIVSSGNHLGGSTTSLTLSMLFVVVLLLSTATIDSSLTLLSCGASVAGSLEGKNLCAICGVSIDKLLVTL